jgi:hypothetical protein
LALHGPLEPSAGLLYDVRQFVSEQPATGRGFGREPAVGEHDVLANGIGIRANVAR